MSDHKQDAIEELSLTVREQYLKLERLEIENAKLNNYIQRVKDAVKSFEALDKEVV